MKGIPNSFNFLGIDIRFYGIIMALSMLFGVLLACKNSKYRNLVSDNIITMAFFTLPMAVIGARLFYVLGSDHSYTFWQIFEIWKGGMSIYGGVIGGAVGIALYCIIFKKNFLDVGDVACVSLILGQAIGRWGNFFNQEVYGKVVSNSSLQWFPFAVLLENGTWHYALFFYESLINFAIFALLMVLIRRTNKSGIICGIYLIAYGFIRFLLEPLRDAQYNLMIFGLKLSSITSAIAVLFGIVIIVLIYTKLRRGKIEKK